ncbi:thioredoxin family protein [Fodinibius saliphilus]|uniref:thioredoxin family protein n=1 Tax=Fodinibius saliphilus TaxID=1920650 RepID=UPI001107F9E1|nr:thioredoxin domain-containing protein [Fodinibius saliphilus]
MNPVHHTYFWGFILLLLVLVATIPASAQQIQWLSFEDALTDAQKKDKLIFVDVWAPWCGWCYKMKNETYPNLSNTTKGAFIFTRINRDSNENRYNYEGNKYSAVKLAQKFKINSVPGIVILSAKGEYLLHTLGFLKTKKLEQILQKVRKATAQQQKCCVLLHGQ